MINKRIFRGIAASAVALMSVCASAQSLQSLYFLEGNKMRHNLNPALADDSANGSYFTLPVIGGTQVGVNSNMGLESFIVNKDGQLVTFLHPSVSADEAMSRFDENNRLLVNADLNVLSVGFRALGGFNTIDLNVRVGADASLPKELFRFMKEGQTADQTEYVINDVRVTSTSYAEAALGHARHIGNLSVGARVKALFGLNYADAKVDNMRVYMSDSKWMISQQSSLVASQSLKFKMKNGNEIDGVDDYKFDGVSGFGLGLDLGAKLQITKALSVSAAITDLGFMNWSKCQTAHNVKDSFEYTGFDNIGVEDNEFGENEFDDAAEKIGDDLQDLVKFQLDEGESTNNQSLRTTIRAGVEYGVLDNKVSFGLLGTMQTGAVCNYTEAMLTANFRPCRWLNAAVNGSASSLGNSFGAVVNFHPKGVGFFAGFDYLATSYGSYMIPVKHAKMSVAFGLSVNL